MERQTADRWIKAITSDGTIRAVAIQATSLVRDAMERHELSAQGGRQLGEALMAALLVSSYCKRGERINLNIRASGHCKQALVDAYPDGTVRGYVIERPEGEQPEMPLEFVLEGEDDDASPETAPGPWGSGLLSILRTKQSEGQQPFIGTVPLLTGHLAKDLTFYWLQSEQVPSAVGLYVDLDEDRVTAAGGFLIQALPGADDDEVKRIQRDIQQYENFAEEIAHHADPVSVLSRLVQTSPVNLIDETALAFTCTCSWDRVNRALALVGSEELRSILTEDNEAIVRCDFCTKEYRVMAKDLEALISDAEEKERRRG